MKKRKNPLSHVRFVYRPGSVWIKIALLAVLVLSTAALITIHTAINRSEKKHQALRNEAITLEQENQSLQEDIDQLGSRDSIIEIAGKQLGLVPNIILYITGEN